MKAWLKQIMGLSLILVGAVLFLDGLILSTIINFNIGLVGVSVLGFVTCLAGLFFERLRQWCKRGWPKWLLRMSILSYVLFLVAALGLAIYGETNTVNYKEDALIVLGAGIRGESVTMPLKYRLESAVAYHLKNPRAVIVVSGGQGSDEAISEALAMEKYLVKRGVPASKIIKEAASTSTYENFVFSKRLLDQLPNFNKPYHVAFVSNGFHLFRAQKIAACAGLLTTHKTASLDFYMWPVVYVREVVAVMKFMILGP